jgi:phage shock protein A
MSGLSDSSAFEAFNRMAEKIEEDERRNLAQAEVTEALVGDTLETEFVRLEAGTGGGGADVEARLSALKQQMGLLPAASSTGEEAKQLAPGDEEAEGGDQPADEKVRDAEVEEVSEEEAQHIPEAQLIEEFDRLGDKPAD